MTEGKKRQIAIRLPYLDYARVFVAFLVIFGHSLLKDEELVRPHIYAFHMPFFFLVSGMLHKDMGCIAWKKYLKTLIVPFLFFNLIFFILWPILGKIHIWDRHAYNPDVSILSNYWNFFQASAINIIKGKTPPDGPTWFLLALLWCKLITDAITQRRWILPAVLCVVFVLSLVVFHNRALLRIGNALMVMPFFYGGFRYKKQIQQWCEKRQALIVGIALLLISIPLTRLNGRVSTDVVRFGYLLTPLNAIVFYANAFVSSFGVLAICMQFKSRPVVTLSAKALITILCIQQLFVYSYRNHCNQTNLLHNFIVSVFILIACVIIHQLLDRYLPFAVGKYKK